MMASGNSIEQQTLADDSSSSRPSTSHARWTVCALLFFATSINYMDRQVLGILAPVLQHSIGWTEAQYGYIVSAFQFAYAVGLILAGQMVDRFGTRIGYAIVMGIWSISAMGHSLARSALGFGIARFFLGLGESGNFPAAIKATTEWFPSEERALATGLFNSGSNASAFIAPILIAAVTARFGWHAAFICTGSMGLVWCVIWIIFPYNKLRRSSTTTQRELAPVLTKGASYSTLVQHRGFWAFCIGKGLTDPIWWFYLFYLPKFLNDNYGLDLNHVKYPLIVIYTVASVGSIAGGWLSGFLMNRGHTINFGRKAAMLVCALCVLPIIFVPYMGHIFPTNAWPAIGLFCLATAAHQGWSANIFSTPGDMFPSTAISTVVGIGGAAGAAGGACFTWVVKRNLSQHQFLVFAMAAGAYITALLIFQLLVPRLGYRRPEDIVTA